MPENQKIKDFLISEKIHHCLYDEETIIKTFQEEMRLGLENNERGLDMFPTYITVPDTIPVGKPVIVIDAGGTNLRIVVISFKANLEPDIIYFEKYSLPGIIGDQVIESFLRNKGGTQRPMNVSTKQKRIAELVVFFSNIGYGME